VEILPQVQPGRGQPQCHRPHKPNPKRETQNRRGSPPRSDIGSIFCPPQKFISRKPDNAQKGSASSSPDRTNSAPRPAFSRTSGFLFTLYSARGNRGREIPVEEIAEDLEAQGFHPIGVHRMRRLISKKELPLVLVELPPSEKNIFELKTVCFLTVNVEKPRRNGWVSQCHNCQWFHHSQRNCRAAPRCVKCGNNHSSNTSEKSKETPAICANCGGSHTASYRGCCKFPQPKNAPAKPRQQQKPKPPSENEKSKSAPEIAPQVNSTRPVHRPSKPTNRWPKPRRLRNPRHPRQRKNSMV
jgi:hypothetical protein